MIFNDSRCYTIINYTRHTIIYGIWKNQEQRSLEKYGKGLIISKLMEEKKEDTSITLNFANIPPPF